MCLALNVKPFSFNLLEALQTSKGIIKEKSGWLIHIENSIGNYGWGEVSPLSSSERVICEELLKRLSHGTSRHELEQNLAMWPKALAFGIGSALGELDGLIGLNSNEGWLKAPPSAILLPSNQVILSKIDYLVENQKL